MQVKNYYYGAFIIHTTNQLQWETLIMCFIQKLYIYIYIYIYIIILGYSAGLDTVNQKGKCKCHLPL